MYEQLFTEPCGMFHILHYITIILFFALLGLFIFLSKKMSRLNAEKLIKWLGILVTVLEVIKIIRRSFLGEAPGRLVPLFFCSLFIFATWLLWLPGRILPRMGYSFMTMGGILAAIGFTFYPSTSLGMYPLLSFPCLHSFVYHLIMCYCGILALWKGLYRPKKRDAFLYFIFVFTACIVSLPVNEALDSNCMFLMHPFGLPVLDPLLQYSRFLYIAVVSLAQSVLMFWIHFGLYSLMGNRLRKRQLFSEKDFNSLA